MIRNFYVAAFKLKFSFIACDNLLIQYSAMEFSSIKKDDSVAALVLTPRYYCVP